MDVTPPNLTTVLLLVLQGGGVVIMFLIGLTLKKISTDTEENRNSITSVSKELGNLALKMSEKYVTKEEHGVTRERVHDLTEDVTALKTLTRMPDMHRKHAGD